jgi:hypothetical protein
MRGIFSKCVAVVGVGFVVIATQGCKKAAPVAVQPVVKRSPAVSTVPDFAGDSLPVRNVDVGGASRQGGRRRTQLQAPMQTMDTQPPTASQRRQDALLLQQQQAASQRQQQEVNTTVQRSVQAQQQVQEEQRIQEAPEQPLTPPVQPGQEPPRIQDTVPGPQMVPAQPTQPQPLPPQ